MSAITAVMIDSREPDFFKNMKFGGIPTTVTMLDTGDVLAVTNDGHTLIIERKTPDDFLNTLKDDRLFPQMSRMVEARNKQIAAGETITNWPYLVITEPLTANHEGKVITDRGVTGWGWASVMGTILSIQELGVYVVFANGQNDYQDCILRIGKRTRNPEMKIMPARIPNVLGPKATFLASLPGIGIERVQDILKWSDDNIAHALIGLTDLDIPAPVGIGLRKKIKEVLGLEENQTLEIFQKEITT